LESSSVIDNYVVWKVRPADQGVVVLGIYRTDGEFVGAPNKDSIIEKGDVLMVCGRNEDVRKALNT